MLASVTHKAKALSGFNSKFISYTLKDLQGLCSKQVRTQLLPLLVPRSSWALDSSLFSQMTGKERLSWEVYGSSPGCCLCPTGQKSNGYRCNRAGGWETWGSCVPKRKGE